MATGHKRQTGPRRCALGLHGHLVLNLHLATLRLLAWKAVSKDCGTAMSHCPG